MTSRRWSWVGACSTGTSHLKAGTGCDDAGACLEVVTPNGPILVAVVSDGAGSAHLSSFGARIVSRSFCRSALAFVGRGGRPHEVGAEVVAEWLDDLRDRVDQAARRRAEHPRSFAATLIGCLVHEDRAAIVHIGDGACALRLTGEREWRVPSWPAQGEYASTTYFVTDDPQPRTTIAHVAGKVAEIALFSDGLERLALDFATVTAFAPFFESMFPALRKAPPGRNRLLSADLRAFLDGPTVIARTDDDKTLVMARRT
ncbi:MAG: PP2C family serine/threonine-protein phosphatase [Methylocella sp.]